MSEKTGTSSTREKRDDLHEETMPISSISQTYELPYDTRLEYGESILVGGFRVVGRGDNEVQVAINDTNQPISEGREDVKKYMESVIFADENEVFLRQAFYNRVAQLKDMTVPNPVSQVISEENLAILKKTGLEKALMTGSLKNLEGEGGHALVLSQGGEPKEKENIEKRADEMGLYSELDVRFPGSSPGGSHVESCIILTDAMGNHMLLPNKDGTTHVLEELFGYERLEGSKPLFDVQAELNESYAKQLSEPIEENRR